MALGLQQKWAKYNHHYDYNGFSQDTIAGMQNKSLIDFDDLRFDRFHKSVIVIGDHNNDYILPI